MKFVLKQSAIVAACVSQLGLFLTFVLFTPELLTQMVVMAIAFIAAFFACFVALQFNHVRTKAEAWRERASWIVGLVAGVVSLLLVRFLPALFR